MNHGPEDFSDLSKLLALKRHEQPPPGFFFELPDKICARIEAGAARSEPWWRGFFFSLDFRPALAGALGLAAFGVYFLGMQVAEVASVPASEPTILAMDSMGAPLSPSSQTRFPTHAHVSPASAAIPRSTSSMNPFINPGTPAPVGMFDAGAGMKASPSLMGFSVIR